MVNDDPNGCWTIGQQLAPFRENAIMTLTSRIALALAATMLWPLAAGAADYDPPIVIDEAPEYVPVEVGSGWYLRGDVGYNITKSPYDVTFNGVDSSSTPINGSIGAGYHFTDYFRGELNVGFLSNDKYDWTDGTDLIRAESNIWSGMANAYADLGTIAGFTPYVGGGVGLLYSSRRIDDTFLGISDRETQYALAYSLGAGVAYKVAQNTSIDVGYQYLSAPSLEYFDIPSGEMRKGVDYHQVKVGLRYDLW
jgi:opacity protein-like surface antigen